MSVLVPLGLESSANSKASNSVIVENGTNLPESEKRICLVRALLSITDILILDETLANLQRNYLYYREVKFMNRGLLACLIMDGIFFVLAVIFALLKEKGAFYLVDLTLFQNRRGKNKSIINGQGYEELITNLVCYFCCWSNTELF